MDVDQFPGHIACDGASKSEIVVPIVKEGKVCFDCAISVSLRECFEADCAQVVAIIDVDCAELNGFTKEDQEALEELADLLATACHF